MTSNLSNSVRYLKVKSNNHNTDNYTELNVFIYHKNNSHDTRICILVIKICKILLLKMLPTYC